jgi:hypothetical protein
MRNHWGSVLACWSHISPISFIKSSSIFWDITPCSRLHFEGRRISQARNQPEAGSKQNNTFAKFSVYVGHRSEMQDRSSVPIGSPLGQNEPIWLQEQLPSSHCPSHTTWRTNWISWLILWPRKLREHVPPKRLLTLNGLHGVTSQTTELFIATALRTSNPAFIIVFVSHGVIISNNVLSKKVLVYKTNRQAPHRSVNFCHPLSFCRETPLGIFL